MYPFVKKRDFIFEETACVSSKIKNAFFMQYSINFDSLMGHRQEQPSRKPHADDGSSPSRVPALASRNFAWWSRVYGARFRLAAAESLPLREQLEELFEAIRENRRAAVEAVVLHHPHVAVVKVQYVPVASCFEYAC